MEEIINAFKMVKNFVVTLWNIGVWMMDLPDLVAQKLGPIAANLPGSNYLQYQWGLWIYWGLGGYCLIRWALWATKYTEFIHNIGKIFPFPLAESIAKLIAYLPIWLFFYGMVMGMMRMGLIPAIGVTGGTFWFFHRERMESLQGLASSGIGLAGRTARFGSGILSKGMGQVVGTPKGKRYAAAFMELYKGYNTPTLMVGDKFDLGGFEAALHQLKHNLEHDQPEDKDLIEVAFDQFVSNVDLAHGHATPTGSVLSRMLDAVSPITTGGGH